MRFKNNLLVQFSLVTFVIMVILALIVSFVLVESLDRNLELLTEYDRALAAGETIEPSDPFSIQGLSRQVSNLKWVTLAAIGGSFIYLYATLVYMVWEGWKTIVWQRAKLESTNVELEKSVVAARELQGRREAFVSIASHELRTPMTAIMGFSELLLSNPDTPEATRQDWLTRIHQNGEVLSAIVDDMLDLSRIQMGRLALNQEYLRLDTVIEEVLSGIRPGTDSHSFVVEVPSDVPDIWADREKFAQVLMNLATNAVKYSPAGGSITISAHHEPDRERAVVDVADEGIGIAPEDQEQLFSSFYRIRRPETESIKGTGPGLSIVRGLVGLMSGEVWAASEVDKGSTFSFSIPTVPPDVDEVDTRKLSAQLE